MACPVTVVFAFRSEKKTVQALVLADGRKAITTSSQQLMDVTLVADVKEDLVFGSVEDSMQCDREFNDAQVWAQVTACLR